MTLEIIIQKGENRYEAVINPDIDYNISFGLFGEGQTVSEAIEDFMISYDEIKSLYKDEGKSFPHTLDFIFKYDLASFLAYYSKVLSLAGLERLTGVNQGQLSHYINGRRNPGVKTKKKIETALHQFSKELSQIHFV